MAASMQFPSLWQRFQERLHALARGEPQAASGGLDSLFQEVGLALKAGSSPPRAQWDAVEG